MNESRQIQLFLFSVLGAVFIPWLVRRRLGPLVIPFVYFGLHCAVFGFYPGSVFGDNIAPLLADTIRTNVLQIYAMILVFAILLGQSFPYKVKKWIVVTLYVLMIIDSVVFFLSKNRILFGWSTFESAMLMCFVPMLIKEERYLALILTLALVAVGGSNTVLLCGAGLLIATVISSKSIKWMFNISGLIAIVWLGLTIYFSWDHIRVSYFERTHMWSDYFAWFNSQPWAWLTGFGLGSFEVLGRNWPTGDTAHRYYLMHNDYLQILFETGLPGLLVTLWTCGYLLWRSHQHTWQLATLIIFMVMGLTYFPLHFFGSQSLILILVHEVLFWPMHKRSGKFYVVKRMNNDANGIP